LEISHDKDIAYGLKPLGSLVLDLTEVKLAFLLSTNSGDLERINAIIGIFKALLKENVIYAATDIFKAKGK